MRTIATGIITLIFLLGNSVLAQNEKAFVIYNAKGKKVSYKKMKKAALENEYILFGEYHDNPIVHWLQYELTDDLHAVHGNKLKLSFEQLEQDQQLLLNDYLVGKFDEKAFKDTMRLWPNHKTDYQPLIQFAKNNKLYCVAANIPRKYASLLYKKGRAALDTLSATEKSYMAPLDFKVDTTLSQYQVFLTGEMHGGGMNMLLAQAIKDATMAHFMMKNKNQGEVVIHYVGAFHSDFHQGIMWYLKEKQPNSTVMTISTVTQSDINKLDAESKGRADYVICVPETMTRTH
jgi:uncharacterized iron-regulated protein